MNRHNLKKKIGKATGGRTLILGGLRPDVMPFFMKQTHGLFQDRNSDRVIHDFLKQIILLLSYRISHLIIDEQLVHLK